jgi:hypothetical protein
MKINMEERKRQEGINKLRLTVTNKKESDGERKEEINKMKRGEMTRKIRTK